MTNTFEESQHPRGAAGKFAMKTTPAPSGSLGASDAEIDAAFSDDTPTPAPGGSERIEALLDAAHRDADIADEYAAESDRKRANARARVTALGIMSAVPDATGVSVSGNDPELDYSKMDFRLSDGRTATWDGYLDMSRDHIELTVSDGSTRRVPVDNGAVDRVFDAQMALYEMGSTQDPLHTGGVTKADGEYHLTWNDQGEVPNQPQQATASTIPARERVKAATTHLREAVAQHDRLRMEIVRESAAAIDPLATKLSFRTEYGDDGLGIMGGFRLHRADGSCALYDGEVTRYDADGEELDAEPIDYDKFNDVYDNLLSITEPETLGVYAQEKLPGDWHDNEEHESRREISLTD